MSNHSGEIVFPAATAQLLQDKDRTDRYQDPVGDFDPLVQGELARCMVTC